ncbi:MAG: DNA/RNA non-specific endonuclease [Porphyromonas sp.]|nr:DNA/RNA non-specific endonuclease [Porphyromonas sp.]
MAYVLREWMMHLLAVAVLLGVPSCQDKSGKELQQEIDARTQLRVSSVKGQRTLKALGSAWAGEDEIGLYVVNGGQQLSTDQLYKGYSNLQYVTPEGDGLFVPTAKNAKGVVLGKELVDVVAYAPYRADVVGFEIPLDVSDQSDLEALNLLYSDNVKGKSVADNRAQLHFTHQLAQLVLEVEGVGAISSLQGIEAELSGLVSDGSFDLVGGTLALGSTKSTTKLHSAVVDGRKATFTALLLPKQDLKEGKLLFELGSYRFSWDPIELPLEANSLYRLSLKLQVSLEGAVEVVLQGATITDLDEEVILGGIAVPGTEPEPTPDPEPTPEPLAWYAEMPMPMSGTNPANTLDVVLHMAPDYWFSGGSTVGGERRNYSFLYSTEYTQPLWVAYPLYGDCFGGQKRTDAWDYDPIVARQYQPNLKGSYQGGSYDRGHMLASSARTASRPLNETTFYYTNMAAQQANLNQGAWVGLEKQEQNWAKNSRYDTLYVVCGPIFPEKITKTTSDRSGKPIPIADYYYKVLLHKEKSTGRWYSIGFKMSNAMAIKNEKDWPKYAVSVKSIEEEVGFKFFTHLDPEIADEVKSSTSRTHFP